MVPLANRRRQVVIFSRRSNARQSRGHALGATLLEQLLYNRRLGLGDVPALTKQRRWNVYDPDRDDPDDHYEEAANVATPPPGSCDCHAHVFGPSDRYSFASSVAVEPEDRTLEHYRRVQARLGTSRVVLVQPSHYGTDNACLIDAVEELSKGPDGAASDNARGIAAVRAEVEDAELEDLKSVGMVGARFQMTAGREAYEWEAAGRLAWRVHDHGWTVSLRMNGSDLHEVEQRLGEWPGRVIIDHIGNFQRTKTLNQRGFKALTRLIDRDKAWVNLSAPYESSRRGAVDDPEVAEIARALIDWAPERMIWGSNWPHPARMDDPPDDTALLKLLQDWVPEESRRHRILRDNPIELFEFEPVRDGGVGEDDGTVPE